MPYTLDTPIHNCTCSATYMPMHRNTDRHSHPDARTHFDIGQNPPCCARPEAAQPVPYKSTRPNPPTHTEPQSPVSSLCFSPSHSSVTLYLGSMEMPGPPPGACLNPGPNGAPPFPHPGGRFLRKFGIRMRPKNSPAIRSQGQGKAVKH